MQLTYGIRQLANWILDYAESRQIGLTNMSLNKLVYFSYEYALVSHERKLTNAKIEAWEHGPVFREVYRSFKDNGGSVITDRACRYNPETDAVEIASPNLSPDDAYIVTAAIVDLVCLPASVLREISHESGGAWATTWHHEGLTNPGMHISDDVIRSCGERRRVFQ